MIIAYAVILFAVNLKNAKESKLHTTKTAMPSFLGRDAASAVSSARKQAEYAEVMCRSRTSGPAAKATRLSVAKATNNGEGVAVGGDQSRNRTRSAILEDFVALYAERGDEGSRVEAICRRARLSRAPFYRQVEDRADLLERGLDGFFAGIGK
jgi:hypothetical protein